MKSKTKVVLSAAAAGQGLGVLPLCVVRKSFTSCEDEFETVDCFIVRKRMCRAGEKLPENKEQYDVERSKVGIKEYFKRRYSLHPAWSGSEGAVKRQERIDSGRIHVEYR